MNIVLTVVAAIFVFGILIFVHELGHFTAAKASGIKVLEFALGMGPKLISRTRGETTYSLRLFPIGGFCAMEGEDEESHNERAFCNAKLWKRIVVTVAGPLTNLLLALLISLFFVLQAESLPTLEISQFASQATTNASLQTGDVLYRVNGYRIRSSPDLEYVLMRARSSSLDVEVLREGEKVLLPAVPFITHEVEDYGTLTLRDFYFRVEDKHIGNVVPYAISMTINQVRQIWGTLADLIGGKFGLSALSGPVGISTVIGEATSSSYAEGYAEGGVWRGIVSGLTTILSLMCLISVNLGVMNLLPIPALDGGRLLFLLIEAVRRKPIPAKYEGIVTTVGFFLLIGLIIVVTVKDVIMLF